MALLTLIDDLKSDQLHQRDLFCHLWSLLLLVGTKFFTWLLKGRARPPQVLEWLVFLLIKFVGLLEGWFTKTKTWLGWQYDMVVGSPWMVAHK
jgi:hypothetical protein